MAALHTAAYVTGGTIIALVRAAGQPTQARDGDIPYHPGIALDHGDFPKLPGTPMPALFIRLRRATALLTLPLCLLASGCAHLAADGLLHREHPLAGRLWDTRSGTFIDEANLLARARQADVVLLGETHDNPLHHRLQERVLDGLLAERTQPALVMEQFNREQQGALDAARSSPAPLDSVAPLAKGWNWPLYQPLVARALDAGLPLVAANASREQIRPVIRDGWASLPAGEEERLALAIAWNAERDARLTQIIETSHCGKIPPTLRDGLVRGQRVRDGVLADAVLQHAAGRREGKVLMIVGRGHARRDLGVPLYLAARAPEKRLLSVGIVEVSPESLTPAEYLAAAQDNEVGGKAHDILWFTPRFDRPDPCAKFGK